MKRANVLATAALWALGGCALVLEDYDQYRPVPPEEVPPDCPSACYSGPPATKDVGVCKAGTLACPVGNETPVCTGEVLPTLELCSSMGSGEDEDCNAALCELGVPTRGRLGNVTPQEALRGAALSNNDTIFLAGEYADALNLSSMVTLPAPTALPGSFVAKYGADGVPRWASAAKYSDGSPTFINDAALGSDGTLYIAGKFRFNDMVTYAYATAVIDMGTSGVVQKMDFQFGNLNAEAEMHALAVGANSELHLIATARGSVPLPNGTLYDGGPGRDMVFLRCAGLTIGSCAIVVPFPGGAHNPTDIVLTPNGQAVVTGTYEGELANLPPSGAYSNGFVLLLDSITGNVEWRTHLVPGAQSSVELSAVTTNSKGQLFVVGTLVNEVTIEGLKFTGTADGDLFVAAFDPKVNPSLLWAKVLGGDGAQKGTGIAVQSDRLFVAGAFDFTTDFGADVLVDLPPQARGPYWAELAAASGTVLWAHTLGVAVPNESLIGVGTEALMLVPSAVDPSKTLLAGHSRRRIELSETLDGMSQDIFFGLVSMMP